MENEQNKNLNDILEVVNFIKDNAASKDDLAAFATNVDNRFFNVEKRFNSVDKNLSHLDDKISEVKQDVITKIDAFAVYNQKFETELAALKSKYDRMEGVLMKVLTHLNLKV